MLESISTLLAESTLPSSFWGEAAEHFTFTRNHIPSQKVTRKGKKVHISCYEMLTGRVGLNLKYLMPFGTKVTVFKPKETRQGHKTPGQQKAYDAILIGYIQGMGG